MKPPIWIVSELTVPATSPEPYSIGMRVELMVLNEVEAPVLKMGVVSGHLRQESPASHKSEDPVSRMTPKV